MTLEEIYECSQSGFGVPYYDPPVEPFKRTTETSDGVRYVSGPGQRHSAVLSPNNPYLKQLETHTSQADGDALFELAIKWEADYQALQEQREYDSPTAQIQRQREAGINPDIAGSAGSAGSSVSSGSSATLGDQENTTSFRDSYRDQEIDLAKQSNRISAFNSIVNLASTAIGGIQSLSMLPSQLKLSRTQADIASSTADNVKRLSDNQVTQSNLQTNLLDTQNLVSRFDLLSRLSSMFTPDSSPEDITGLLTTLGMSADEANSYVTPIQNYMGNPVIKNLHQSAKNELRRAEAWNRTYTPELLTLLADYDVRITTATNQLTLNRTNIENGIARALNNEAYINMSSNNEILRQKNTGLSFDYQNTQLLHDICAHANKIEQITDEYIRINDMLELVQKEYEQQPTAARQATIDALTSYKSQLLSLGSSELPQLWNIAQRVGSIRYMYDVNLNGDGNVETSVGIDKHNGFVGYTFQEHLVNRDPIMNTVSNLLGIGSTAATNIYSTRTAAATKLALAPK